MSRGFWFIVVVGVIMGTGRTCDSLDYYEEEEEEEGVSGLVDGKLSPEEQYYMEGEILTLLGLDDSFMSRSLVKDASLLSTNVTKTTSAMFLLDVYSSITHSGVADGEAAPRKLWNIVNDNRFHLSSRELKIIEESDTIVSFKNIGNQDELQWTKVFWFDTNRHLDGPNADDISSGELRLFKEPSSTYGDKKAIVKVYQLVEGTTGDSNLLDSSIIRYSDMMWLTLDVTNALLSWKRDYKSNQGLMVEMRDPDTQEQLHPHSLGFVGGKKDFPDKQSFMVAFFNRRHNYKRQGMRVKRFAKGPKNSDRFERSSSFRSRRKMNNRQNDIFIKNFKQSNYVDSHNTHCKKHPFYVSFKDLGWSDWIIAPQGYQAGYCFGVCDFPLNSHLNATNHAIVQTLVRLMTKRVSGPCCVPHTLGSVNFLYADEGKNVILKKFVNMVASSCGCH